MNDDLLSRYQRLNNSYKQVLVYHLGIDSGFFTEFSFMINAMLYCLTNKIQFRLYSEDANFGYAHGWNDYFEPFCTTDTRGFHHKCNYHRVACLGELLARCKRNGRLTMRQGLRIARWKFKLHAFRLVGKLIGRIAYSQDVLFNSDIPDCKDVAWYDIPDLGIWGNYQQAFAMLVQMVWRFRPEVQARMQEMEKMVSLPAKFVGCQMRGGDKATETKLVSPDRYMSFFRKHYPDIRDLYVLTDDYRILECLRQGNPDYRFHSLCTPDESGYHNRSFSDMEKESKRVRFERFMCSIELLKQAVAFVGSITTGPSLFMLKCQFVPSIPIDCPLDGLSFAVRQNIASRSEIAQKSMP